MMKRLVVGVFVSSIGLFGVVPAATAATSSHDGVVKATSAKAKSVKVKTVKAKVKTVKIIDWDAPAPVQGGFTAQRIDWD